jgi:hypothetical protein
MGYFKEKFTDWLIANKNLQRPKQFAGYMDAIANNLLTPMIGSDTLINDIDKAIHHVNGQEKVLEALDLLYDFFKRLHAIAVNGGANSAKAITILKQHNIKPSNTSSWTSVIDAYKLFMTDLINNGSVRSSSTHYRVTLWNKDIDEIKKIESEVLAFNGTDSLLARFNNQASAFISTVMRDSFFFSKKDAEERFTKISKDIQHNNTLPARESIDNTIQSKIGSQLVFLSEDVNTHKKLTINIVRDPDGNKFVRDLIANTTGYKISTGDNSNFQYYIISHIWGDAFDPRNFTSFWNLSIVPAWANFILDKGNSNGLLAKQLINTFKAVCFKHYAMKKMNWKSIGKNVNQMMPNRQFVVHGSYTINVIDNKKNGAFGRIKTVSITV